MMEPAFFLGLEVLATAVVLMDSGLAIRYVNPSAENLFEVSGNNVVGHDLGRMFPHDGALAAVIANARSRNCSYTEHDMILASLGNAALHLSCTVTPCELHGFSGLLAEFRPIDRKLKIEREERLLDQSQASRELIRNLAHEIRNPLGGIRGAAQLLERELGRRQLREYTQVIVNETDRLQVLLDRLLTPHHLPQIGEGNIHQALERVRSLILAESPGAIEIRRDYDVSIPLLKCDQEQIIQAVLNIVRNAAQAMDGKGVIILRTRIARQVTLARKRYRHALQLSIIDHGPGIPQAIRDRVFDPLVTGRDGGSGLGLTLAQTFINQHGGTIAFESVAGNTCFTIMLPLGANSG